VVDLIQPYPKRPKLESLDLNWLDDSCFEVNVNKGVAINELFQSFNQASISVSSIRPKSNRLETLFVDLVRK